MRKNHWPALRQRPHPRGYLFELTRGAVGIGLLIAKFEGPVQEREPRVHHAETLLQQSDSSVKQAAMTVGFPNQLHFSRVFRKVLGVAPTALKGIR